MKKIMLVSEWVADFGYFIEPLKMKYEVDPTAYISTARRWLEKKSEEYILIIIGIKMLTLGEFSLEEAQDGYITGIIWYKKELANLGIPVIFWSYYDPNYDLEIEKLKKEYPNNKIDLLWRDNDDKDHLLYGVERFLNLKK